MSGHANLVAAGLRETVRITSALVHRAGATRFDVAYAPADGTDREPRTGEPVRWTATATMPDRTVRGHWTTQPGESLDHGAVMACVELLRQLGVRPNIIGDPRERKRP